MARWEPSITREDGGRFVLVASPPGQAAQDITVVRGVPVKIENYDTADPFGWAGARLDLPMITGFDDFDSPELKFLSPDTLIDLWWVPADTGDPTVISGLTNKVTYDYFSNDAVKVWEGHVMAFNQRESDTGDGWGLDLVGAMYQLDGYKAKPEFPYRPVPFEVLLKRGFDPRLRPHLKTHPNGLYVRYPAGWSKVVTADMINNPTIYTPSSLPAVGKPITGYSTRNTGAWDNWLTSFAQDLLAVMWVDDESGVTPGNQWTLMCFPGRRCELLIRDRQRTPDFELWYGTPGMAVTGLSADYSQTSHVLYGEGEALDGTQWRNADISIDGDHTEYIPMVVDQTVYPMNANNVHLDKSRIIRERMIKFSPGISQEQAQVVVGPMAQNDKDPGWTGTLTLKVDPEGMSRWAVRAGMTVLIKGIAGTGAIGRRFHINETSANPEEGTVTCKIDSKYRDLLAFEEAVARTRDPLIPSKLLQIGKASITIEDRLAPWDYKAGAGFIPRAAKRMHADKPDTVRFPWSSWTQTHQPISHPDWYVKVWANSSDRRKRWSFFPILVSAKGQIRLTQLAAYDRYGVQTRVPFHFSIYKNPVDAGSMPFDDLGPSPYIDKAFQTVTEDGYPMPADSIWGPDASLIIGWGDSDQKAGYSPGSESDGDPVTGRLVDASTWSYDLSDNPEFDPVSKKKQPTSAYTIYGAIYAEYTEPLYFTGRLFRQSQGGGV